jgi:hypothetical protein
MAIVLSLELFQDLIESSNDSIIFIKKELIDAEENNEEEAIPYIKLKIRQSQMMILFCKAVITPNIKLINLLYTKIQDNYVDILEIESIHSDEGDYINSANDSKFYMDFVGKIKNSNGNFIITSP